MANWAHLFGVHLNWSGTSLTAYLDKFIEKANNYTPPILIDFYMVSFYSGFIVFKSYKNDYSVDYLIDEGDSNRYLCMNSSLITVYCEFESSSFKWFNFTFWLRGSYAPPSSLAFNIDINDFSTTKYKNG